MRVLGLLPVAGCFMYSPMPSERAAPKLRKISEAKILEMKVNLYMQQGLCPGKEGKLYANANVQWPGGKPVARSIGSDVDSLPPSGFQVTGPLIKGDANAHLFPSADVLASVDSGFEATIVYTPEPRFTFHQVFPPEYSCYVGWYSDGGTGNTGNWGNGGNNGDVGQHGTHGENGGTGGRGSNGGRVTAYVTIVGTRYYPRLLAVWANDTFFLAPANKPLEFGAAGGQGGNGGNGGDGGAGGDQPTKDVERVEDDGSKHTVRVASGRAGDGGDGGTGGRGGDGGTGGTVDVTYDSQFPELRALIRTDVHGGAGGYGGAGGNAGNGGGTNAEEGAQEGQRGQDGGNGGDGGRGSDGRASVHPGSVASRFASLRGLVIGGKSGQQPATDAPPPRGGPPPRSGPPPRGPTRPVLKKRRRH
jgi:hypothetical protein